MIKLGDVVLIHEENPKNRWQVGVVEELLQGTDVPNVNNVESNEIGIPSEIERYRSSDRPRRLAAETGILKRVKCDQI